MYLHKEKDSRLILTDKKALLTEFIFHVEMESLCNPRFLMENGQFVSTNIRRKTRKWKFLVMCGRGKGAERMRY